MRIRTPEQKARVSEQSRAWAKNNPERVAVIQRRSRAKNADRLKEYRRAWYHANKERLKPIRQAWMEANKEVYRQWQAAHRYRRRNIMFAMFGSSCALCGDAERQHLTLDHIHGDGYKHRKEPGGMGGMLFERIISRILKGKDSADRYRILCWNCNCSIGIRGWSPVEAVQNLYCRDYIAGAA